MPDLFAALDKLDDKNEKKVNKRIINSYQNSLKEINGTLKTLYDKYEDNNGKLDFADLQKFNRFAALQKDIQKDLQSLGVANQVTLDDYSVELYRQNFLYTGYVIESDTNLNFSYVRPKTAELKLLLLDKPVGGLTMKQRLKINDAVLYKRVMDGLTQSVIMGEGRRKTQARLKDVLERDANRMRATARTERNRISGQAREDSMQKVAARGVKIQKVWVATLDSRTRDTHAELDGQVRDIDKPFNVRGLETMSPSNFGIPEEDINCRCTMVSQVKGFDNSKLERRSKSGTFPYKNYEEWEKGLKK